MRALIVASIADFIACFELNDILILKQLGYEIHCASNYTEARKERIEKLDDIGVVHHQVDFQRNPYDKKNITAYKQLNIILKEYYFDLIHCHTPIGGVLTRLSAAKYRKKNTKIIYTAHGFHFFAGAPKKNWLLYYPVEKILSCFTDVLITINTEDYDRAKRKFHAKKTEYIPGVGVDTKRFSCCNINIDEKRNRLNVAKDDFVILSVGELHGRKNQAIVIEALKLLKEEERIDGLQYLIVGEGENRDCYNRLISNYNLQQHVRLLGYRTDIDEICKMSNCFIHPSIREGLGVAALEAMAAGLPLLCADVNGIKDYAENGKTGITFDPYKAEDVKNAIIKIRTDSGFRQRCAAYNVDFVKKFDIEKTASIMNELYKGMTNNVTFFGGIVT